MMETHEQIAAEIAAALPPKIATATGVQPSRQGDVVLVREGEPAEGLEHGPTPEGGVLVQAGVHGEHRLIGARVAWPKPGTVSILGTATLVHTDVPSARHPAIQLQGGTWTYHRSRELVDGIVRLQED